MEAFNKIGSIIAIILMAIILIIWAVSENYKEIAYEGARQVVAEREAALKENRDLDKKLERELARSRELQKQCTACKD
jgi:hypothetical protein